MENHWHAVKKNIYLSFWVVVVGSVELLLLRDSLSLIIFNQWTDLGTLPAGAEYVVEYGYVKGKDGKIYKHYPVIDEEREWENEWLETEDVSVYPAYDKDISTCNVPNIINVKSIVLRCRKLENYSLTYAMAIGKNGRVYDFTGSTIQGIAYGSYLLFLIIMISLNFGILIVVVGYVLDRIGEIKPAKRPIIIK